MSAQVYYHNTVTNASSWTKPEGYTGDEDAASKPTIPLSQERVKGTDWSKVLCEGGKVYYFNVASRVSQHDSSSAHMASVRRSALHTMRYAARQACGLAGERHQAIVSRAVCLQAMDSIPGDNQLLQHMPYPVSCQCM